MKTINKTKIYFLMVSALLVVGGCKKESFVEANLNPTTLYEVKPEDQFLRAAVGSQDDFEYFADVYRAANLWMQYATLSTGNGLNFNNVGSQFNTRYGKIFYGRLGPALADAIKNIEQMPDADKNARIHMKAISQILLSYYAFYVSDINGSIPYTQAFQARYGGTTTPAYDTQQAVFAKVDAELKAAVATLKTTPAGQISLAGNDPYFNGDATLWAKAANALRLKIAIRLIKVDPTKMKAIATEVLADPVQMANVNDSWMLKVGPSYADGGGNFSPANFAAGKPVLDFMVTKGDPRLSAFYRPNAAGNYVGSFTSPDDAKLPANVPLYASINNLSQLQHRLFTPNYNEADGLGAGTGKGFYPVLTYAEYCFLRADLAARGVTTDVAETWYKNGVYASVQFYSDRAVDAKVSNFNAVTTPAIDTYYNTVGIKYDATKATDQIACQAYLDLYRQPLEAWAWWKRTGFPNTTSVLAWSELKGNGSILPLARRAGIDLLSTTNLNYANQQAAIAEMAKNPDFGAGPNDPFGRVWWDKK
ncbi:SusD/RagB family nutrient-binding outer membrane lipoprotein [Pedobacter sp. ISL-68]|uniref:SusD/RagB family nutrient-binding outer membrane lipoprotein n=1 Tax=unclassified Pedobacter TaxID=2628915 RepID=UPI001BEC50E9|nr:MULTISPECIES: SusD/RagB family nutrient-binding outer membrane lipoprotein [unclassified Pedobacter]MBT2564773.1 SusD/RagB family nutrient-binding outer membrane lipoprotein [Pedobacter sp. ISL-64]MBT2593640.1 SusD/RagB family nutrient-binding outer membrane lipoprotein [Pedobacter sp. ISL-68]